MAIRKNGCLIAILGPLVPISGLAAAYTLDDHQPFIGIKAGYQWSDDETYNHNDPEGVIGGIFGGLRFSLSWSWDFGYQYHEKLHAEATGIDVETWLLDSAVRYDWYIQNALSLYGRLGVAYWNLDKTVSSSESLSSTGFSPLGELGINYDINPNLRLSAGYQYINGIGDTKTGEYDSHALMLGLSYNFSSNNGTYQYTSEDEGTHRPVVELSAVSELTPEPVTVEHQVFTLSMSSLSDDFTFESDSVSVGAAFAKELKGVAHILNTYPQSEVHIVGHTDSTGSESYNQALSERRAQSVAEELMRLGVSSSQMMVRGEGELNPISMNKSAEGRTLNRRVELSIPEFVYQK